jgi:acetolactate decarboxylase
MKHSCNRICRIPLAFLFLSFLLLMPALGCGNKVVTDNAYENRDLIYQVSTYAALEAGTFSSDINYDELSKHGDLGIGTFEGLDGEMIELDGEFYQIKTDGKAYHVEGSDLAPFAVITFFESDLEAQPPAGLDYEGLKAYLDSQLPSGNIFYAFKIEGDFAYVKARSVPRQDEPYPPLATAIAEQTVFEFNQVRGTMVGFRCPTYVGGINVPGYHLHFLTADKGAGGHVLDLRLGDVTVSIDDITDLRLELPHIDEFYNAALSGESAK